MQSDDFIKYGAIIVALMVPYCLFMKPKSTQVVVKPCNKRILEKFMGKPNYQSLDNEPTPIFRPTDNTGTGNCPGNYVASALLPKNDPKMKEWADLAPKGPLSGVDLLLEPQKTIGYDTIGNSLRNASYDLRKEVSNPVHQVSPWCNTTMGPDLTRKPLEGCDGWTVNQK